MNLQRRILRTPCLHEEMIMTKPTSEDGKVENHGDGKSKQDNGAGAGEDEGSSAKEGDEDHLHEDQKTKSS